MGDLSAILPTIYDPGASGELPGTTWHGWDGRNPLAQCGACLRRLDVNAGSGNPANTSGLPTHLCWQTIGVNWINAGNSLRYLQEEMVIQNNSLRERWRRLQRLIQLCHTLAVGISSLPDPEYDTMDGTSISMSNGMVCTVNFVGGMVNNGYLINVTSSYNPLAVPYQVVASTSEDDNGNTTYTYATQYCVLPQGVLHLQWASQLWAHGGFLVRLAPGQNLAACESNGQYTYNLLSDTPIGGLATMPMPGQSGPIYGIVQYYATYPEPWLAIRDAYPLYAKPAAAPYVITNPVSTNPKPYTIPTGGLRIPYASVSGGPQVWSLAAQYSADGPWMPVNLGNVVQTIQQGGTYLSQLNLAGVNLAGIYALQLTYLVESTAAMSNTPGPDQSAVIVGEDRCRWSTPDYTCAVGVATTEADPLTGGFKTVNYYCAQRAALEALAGNAGLPFLNNFMPACYQTTCPYFNRETADGAVDMTPTSTWPISEEILAQLIDAYPWMEAGPPPGDSGDAGYTFSRTGTPSLSSLTGRNWTIGSDGQQQLIYSPGGYAGGWPQGKVATSGPQLGQLVSLRGFEFLTARSDGVTPVLNNSNTWPSPGPAANPWPSRMSEYDLDVIVTQANDPQCLELNTPMTGGSYVSRYGGGASSSHGLRQRFNSGYQVFIPQIPQTIPSVGYTVKGNTYQTGYWNANGLPVTNPLLAVYRAKLTLAPFELNVISGTIASGTIFAVQGTQIVLAHKGTLSGSYQTSVGGTPTTITATWQQGATNIYPPDFAVVRNYACAQAITGIARAGQVRRGLCATFSDVRFPAAIQGRRFWITQASACGSSYRQSWYPGSMNAYGQGTFPVSGYNDDSWYAATIHPLWADLPGTPEPSGATYPPGTVGDHYNVFSYCDQIALVDENGLLANNLSGLNAKGYALTFTADGVALPITATNPNGLTIKVGGPATADAAPFGPIMTLAAQGEIYFAVPPPAGSCIIVTGSFADRSCIPLAVELNAPRIILENILQGEPGL